VKLGSRERRLLYLLGAVVLVAGVARLVPLVRGAGPGAEAAGEVAGESGRSGEAVTEVLELRLADLTAQPGSYTAGRDPFRFGEPPPPPVPPGPTPEELAEIARQQEEAMAAQRLLEEEQRRLAAIPPQPQPPQFTLVYLGSFGPERRRIAVFSDGKNIYNASEGDVLEGKFVVARIGFESVDVKFVGFPQEPPRRLAIGG
jgi:hypothetical protein